MTTPDENTACHVSPRVAANLTGVTAERLEELIAAGRVRCQRIDGKRFVNLDDVTGAVADANRDGTVADLRRAMKGGQPG